MRCLRCGIKVRKLSWETEYWRCKGCGYGCWENMRGKRRYSEEVKGWTDVPEGCLMVLEKVWRG